MAKKKVSSHAAVGTPQPLPSGCDPTGDPPPPGETYVWIPNEIVVCRLTLLQTEFGQAPEDRTLTYDQNYSFIQPFPLPGEISIAQFLSTVASEQAEITDIPIKAIPGALNSDLEIEVDGPCYVAFFLDPYISDTWSWVFQRNTQGMDFGSQVQQLSRKYTKLMHLQADGSIVADKNPPDGNCHLIYFEAMNLKDTVLSDPFSLYVTFMEGTTPVPHKFDPHMKDTGHGVRHHHHHRLEFRKNGYHLRRNTHRHRRHKVALRLRPRSA